MTTYDYYKRSVFCCVCIFLLCIAIGQQDYPTMGTFVFLLFTYIYGIFFLFRLIYYKSKDAKEANKKELNDKYIKQIKQDRAREKKIEKEYGTIEYQEKHYK